MSYSNPFCCSWHGLASSSRGLHRDFVTEACHKTYTESFPTSNTRSKSHRLLGHMTQVPRQPESSAEPFAVTCAPQCWQPSMSLKGTIFLVFLCPLARGYPSPRVFDVPWDSSSIKFMFQERATQQLSFAYLVLHYGHMMKHVSSETIH